LSSAVERQRSTRIYWGQLLDVRRIWFRQLSSACKLISSISQRCSLASSGLSLGSGLAAGRDRPVRLRKTVRTRLRARGASSSPDQFRRAARER
jgi:hypothetical protein